jgi:hypothetical protein
MCRLSHSLPVRLDLDSKRESPKKGASVAGTQPRSYSAATDIDGEFLIPNVVPGDYYILGRLPGYVSPFDLAASEFQSDSPESSQAIEAALIKINVASAQTTISNLSLARGASLTGTVHYDDGGLAVNVSVSIYRKDSSGKWKVYKK